MAFKDNFRIEKIYFQRVKDDAQILGSWKNDPRRYSREEIVRVAKDACDSILMLYRLIGECWNDALNQIEKLGAELEALAGKTEAYHDELNEKIDEVNNYLNTQIKNLEIRVENIENSIEDFGGLPSNENANEGDVLTVGENHVNEWRTPLKGLPHYYIILPFRNNDYMFRDGVAIGRLNEETGVYFERAEDHVFSVIPKYFNGECLLSAVIFDVHNEKYISTAEIKDIIIKETDGFYLPEFIFNITSKNHVGDLVSTTSTKSWYEGLFLALDFSEREASDILKWERITNDAAPVIGVPLG